MKRYAVLLIDDSPEILRSLARALRGEGRWRVLTASGPAAAQPLYADVDVVVTDWAMPDGGGARVLAECSKPVVIYSAEIDGIEHPFRLRKPASAREIGVVLANLMAAARGPA